MFLDASFSSIRRLLSVPIQFNRGLKQKTSTFIEKERDERNPSKNFYFACYEELISTLKQLNIVTGYNFNADRETDMLETNRKLNR